MATTVLRDGAAVEKYLVGNTVVLLLVGYGQDRTTDAVMSALCALVPRGEVARTEPYGGAADDQARLAQHGHRSPRGAMGEDPLRRAVPHPTGGQLTNWALFRNALLGGSANVPRCLSTRVRTRPTPERLKTAAEACRGSRSSMKEHL
ncbi:hypothetical protein [Streptomyces sp. A0592]|uniref:hypothetical protein n=1 Tax=Streptomyces sp. A0592 TaxID=2563099 RepID=UPI00109EB5A0|nr:hypothetical protein [Streptomyces sp. A0592]THA76170.1 hypothetical protein E6U81_35910 [Streptomyces sp. A0592]